MQHRRSIIRKSDHPRHSIATAAAAAGRNNKVRVRRELHHDGARYLSIHRSVRWRKFAYLKILKAEVTESNTTASVEGYCICAAVVLNRTGDGGKKKKKKKKDRGKRSLSSSRILVTAEDAFSCFSFLLLLLQMGRRRE